ncbi:MAG: hypothetical protein QOH60_5460 [Mycobacterium sp.]|jgi:hypothetical protein|nr:hypothetical protein [Mycobacterium sp.]
MAEPVAATEHDLMADTLRRLAEGFDGEALSKALDDFGFAELLAEAPRGAVSALFDALGRAGSMSAAIQDVLLLPLAAVLPDGTDGHCVVLPTIGATVVGAGDEKAVTLRGLLLGQRPGRALLAPVAMSGGTVWVQIKDPGRLSTRVVSGLDPALGMTEVTADGIAATVVADGQQARTLGDAVVTAGRLALGYQIVGAVGKMIDLAITHARDRVQFGRPIGSFQGVRNRLADAYVAREAAVSALDMAWEADDPYLAGMLAKSLAGRSARIAATHCQQVLAGIGFTAEHPFHRYLARALVLDSVLGSAIELRRAIGAYAISTGNIPRLVEL